MNDHAGATVLYYYLQKNTFKHGGDKFITFWGGWPLTVAKLEKTDRSQRDHWPFHAEMKRLSLFMGRATAENGLCRRSPDRHKIASVTPVCYYSSASPLS
jgi:hypothetical protein